MGADEVAILFEYAAAVLCALIATGIICTAVGIWRDEKNWKGDGE